MSKFERLIELKSAYDVYLNIDAKLMVTTSSVLHVSVNLRNRVLNFKSVT